VPGKLNIGVIVESVMVCRWQYRIIERLTQLDLADVSCLIITGGDMAGSRKNGYSRAYNIYQKLDRSLYSRGINYDSLIDIRKLARDPLMIVNREKPEGVEAGPGGSSDTLVGSIDLLLNFGLEDPADLKYDIPEFGVISFSIGNSLYDRQIPPAYWEVVKKMPGMTCYVTILRKGSPKPEVINRTSVPVLSSSVRRNLGQAYGVAALIIPRIVRGIRDEGPRLPDRLADRYGRSPEIIDSRYVTAPGPLHIVSNLIAGVINNLSDRILYLNRDKWFILYSIKKDPFPAIPGKFRVLKPPTGFFWADPFVISDNDGYNLFVEELPYKTGKAHLSLIRISPDGKMLSSRKIIERPYHLSYPFVFSHGGKYYMIPETKGSNAIQLFECTGFPSEWEFSMNIMENIAAVDSTLFFKGGKWWLFTSIDELNDPETAYNELFLFYSDDFLSGRWKSHPLNPVVTDIGRSRPAGRIFNYGGKLYRPSQDCTGAYGRAVNINRITELSETGYKEEFITRAEPNWIKKLNGTHTFNFDGDFVVMDAKFHMRRFGREFGKEFNS